MYRNRWYPLDNHVHTIYSSSCTIILELQLVVVLLLYLYVIYCAVFIATTTPVLYHRDLQWT